MNFMDYKSLQYKLISETNLNPQSIHQITLLTNT
jgi:hypothetical protein